ncbi:unnamed protein product, partial [Mesorhabditis belari]|uniref:C-type lectin domain-containing protein n=1 Tax=Mesorhabditis belari TaxID=2138241 RepID=A0AAF3EDP5_9BILA
MLFELLTVNELNNVEQWFPHRQILCLVFSACFWLIEYDNQLGGCLFPLTLNSFDNAELLCNSYGGHLISVHNAFDNGHIVQLANAWGYPSFYLGTRRGNNGSFFNVDGTPANYFNWAPGHPTTDNCVLELVPDAQSISVSCYDAQTSMCFVKQTTVGPPTVPSIGQCPVGWSYFAETGYCYYAGMGASFYDAQSRCQSMNANLASVHSDLENYFILGLTMQYSRDCLPPYNSVWLGGLNSGGNWYWLDGTIFDFRNFYGSDQSSGSLYMTAQIGCGDFTFWRIGASNLIQTYYVCKKVAGIS